MDINSLIRIHDLLKEYPQLEKVIIELNPLFKKLKNPVLRKTVGKIATIEQAAKVAGLNVMEFVNRLRIEVGQQPIESGGPSEVSDSKMEEWMKGEPVEILSGNKILQEGDNPLRVVTEKMKELSSGEFLLLETDFYPSPMIENMKKQGNQVVSKGPDDSGLFLTYICKT